MYPGPDVLQEVGRIAVAGARLDVEMAQLWHHLDRTVPVEEARSIFGSSQRRAVMRLAEQRLSGELRRRVTAAVNDAWAASKRRNEVIHQGWLLRGPDAMRPWADWSSLLPEERPGYLDEWDRESKVSPSWLRVPTDSMDVVPVQALSELVDIERALATVTQRVGEVTFAVASSRETGVPSGYMDPEPRDARKDWVYLSQEQDAALSSLRQAWAVLSEYRFAAEHAEPLFVLLATGAEKLLKLTFGLTVQADTGQWPGPNVMSTRGRGWGHRVADLDGECRSMIRTRAHESIHPHLVIDAIDRMEGDPYAGQWLATLQRYGVNGRFFNLDYLANSPQQTPSPAHLWRELCDNAFRADPEFGQIGGPSADWDGIERRTTARLAQSLWQWWEMYHQAWAQGACGSIAKQYSPALRPPAA